MPESGEEVRGLGLLLNEPGQSVIDAAEVPREVFVFSEEFPFWLAARTVPMTCGFRAAYLSAVERVVSGLAYDSATPRRSAPQ